MCLLYREAYWVKNDRRHTRLEINLPVTLLIAEGDTSSGVTRNLSFSGALIDFEPEIIGDTNLAAVTHIQLSVTNIGYPVTLEVETVTQSDTSLAVAFTDISFSDYTLFKNFLLSQGLEQSTELEREFAFNPALEDHFQLEFGNQNSVTFSRSSTGCQKP